MYIKITAVFPAGPMHDTSRADTIAFPFITSCRELGRKDGIVDP